MNTPELHWFKSSYSDSGDINDCVEVAVAPSAIHIRDSKAPHTPHLTVTATTWIDFLEQL
ncbi:DUF397 domain-containing protein [Streptomyces sp. NPDC088794]|uniref:DUF397 domain-containing protein n=1 Tax=Streptomyces sp. NPDC088794 TaxID=3365902 RepID=UPI0038130941